MALTFLTDETANEITGSVETPKKELTIDTSMLPIGALKNLLTDINALDTDLLKGRVAQYAGFYFDTNDNLAYDNKSDDGMNVDNQDNLDLDDTLSQTCPPTSTVSSFTPSKTNQPNKSLDKLTYYIMFRLPFAKSVKLTFNESQDMPTDKESARKKFHQSTDLGKTIVKEIIPNTNPIKYRYYITIDGNKKTIKTIDGVAIDSSKNVNLIEGNIVYWNHKIKSYICYLYERYYGDPLVNNAVFSYGTPATTENWGYRANNIRVNAPLIFGLKYMNAKAEKVTLTNNIYEAVDDNNDRLGKYTEEPAYRYLGVDPSKYIQDNAKATDSDAANEIINLFNRNPPFDDPTHQLEELEYRKIPIYFFLISCDENPYKSFWVNPKKRSRSLHFPDEISNTDIKYKTRPLIIEGTKEFFNNQYKISPISTTNPIAGIVNNSLSPSVQFVGKFEVNGSNNKIYVVSADCETLNPGLAAAIVGLKGNHSYVAKWNTVIMSKNDTIAGSGITVGFGIDLGTSFHSYYQVHLTINVTNVISSYRLKYEGLTSGGINKNAPVDILKEEIEALTGLHGLVTVTKTGNLYTIIIKLGTKSKDGFSFKYNDQSSILYSCSSPAPVINVINYQEINTDNEYDYLVHIMNRSFKYTFISNNGNDISDNWLDNQEFTDAVEKANFKEIVKKSLGVTHYHAYKHRIDNLALLNKFRLKSYIKHMRAAYRNFIKRYYDQSLFSNSRLKSDYKDILNIAELYVFGSFVYFSGNLLSDGDAIDMIKIACKSHDRNMIKDLIRGKKFFLEKSKYLHGFLGYKCAQGKLDSETIGFGLVDDSFLYSSVKKKLYKNLYE